MTNEPQQLQRRKSFLPFLVAFAIGAFGVYWFQGSESKGPAGNASMAAFIDKTPRADIAPFDFAGPDGSTTELSKWKGRVVLLNLWATWCAPCRKEMPDLAELQKKLGGPEFEVVALSVDAKGAEASGAFLKELGVDNLAVYADQKMKSMSALQAIGLPATLLIDRNGKEAGRVLGPLPWASPEAIAKIEKLIAEK
jgi:thiol-disulfide isomerase/thioredoxin